MKTIKHVWLGLYLFTALFLDASAAIAEPVKISNVVLDQKFKEELVKLIDGQNIELKDPLPTILIEEPFFWIKSESSINTTLRATVTFSLSDQKLTTETVPTPSQTLNEELESIDTDKDVKPTIDLLTEEEGRTSGKFDLTVFTQNNNLIIRHGLASQPKERNGVSVPLTGRQVFLLKGALDTSMLVFTISNIHQQKGAVFCPVKLIGRQAWEDIDVIGKSEFIPKSAQYFGTSALRGSFKSGVNPGKAQAQLITSDNILESKASQDQSEGRIPSVEVIYHRKGSRKKVGSEDFLTGLLSFESGFISASLGGEIILTGPAGQVKTTRSVRKISLIPISLNNERTIELKGRGTIRVQSLECLGVFESYEKEVVFQEPKN